MSWGDFFGKGNILISDKEQYRFYLEEDKKALGAFTKYPITQLDNSMAWLNNPIWVWTKTLRRLEYWENCNRGGAPLCFALALCKKKQSTRLNDSTKCMRSRALCCALWQHCGESPCADRCQLHSS